MATMMEPPARAHLQDAEQYELQDRVESRAKDDSDQSKPTSPSNVSTTSQEALPSSAKETWRDPTINIFRMAAVLLVRH